MFVVVFFSHASLIDFSFCVGKAHKEAKKRKQKEKQNKRKCFLIALCRAHWNHRHFPAKAVARGEGRQVNFICCVGQDACGQLDQTAGRREEDWLCGWRPRHCGLNSSNFDLYAVREKERERGWEGGREKGTWWLSTFPFIFICIVSGLYLSACVWERQKLVQGFANVFGI